MATPYATWVDAWSAASARLVGRMAAANRAAWTAYASDAGDEPPERGGEATAATPSRADPLDRIDADADLAEWVVESAVADPRELAVGDVVRFTKPVSAADVERFAAASGDTNPLHLDEEWAGETRFDGRIVHGTLVSGLISAALARLPGNVVYLSQQVEFRAPVPVGEEVTAVVEVIEDLGEDRFRLRTTVASGDTQVIEGEAVVLVGQEPEVD